MPNLSVTLTAQWSVIDTTLGTPPQIITRSLNNPVYNATAVFADPFFQAGVTATSIPLPASPIFVAYVKNLDPTFNLIVQFTPGSGLTGSFILLAGGVWVYMQQASTSPAGLTSVLLTSQSGAPMNCDVLVAA